MSSTVSELTKKVETLDKMRKVIRVNELSTLSRINKLLTRAENAVSYHQIILNNLQQVQKSLNPSARGGNKKPIAIVVTANRGFCGAYNQNVFQQIDALHDEIGDFDALVIGKYGKNYLEKSAIHVARYIDSPIEEITLEDTAEMSSWLLSSIDKGEYDSIYIVYTQYINAVQSEAKHIELFPTIPTFENNKKTKQKNIHEDLEGILDFDDDEIEMERFLMENYLCGVMYSFLLFSIATEYSARRIAMKNAKESMEEEHAATLKLRNRQQRQESTRELMDIIMSASVLEDKENE
ncbi:hypothetical protein G7062_02210 [Erysipelothrix sp. HDW6C]|uniref:F0F1 ATP synthase subunit gamma n=1 Tax=Erysipelothrix sp. HDW6C TaxID=2714930 RepID=UPI001409D9E8|nr:F0F1 ATP synthase subunit gamma [Erysipelothrix sp. HDW6C]QIK69170.1 hypothetical protein G7062_02210 [Erysipelothrix sp. HDW6C]